VSVAAWAIQGLGDELSLQARKIPFGSKSEWRPTVAALVEVIKAVTGAWKRLVIHTRMKPISDIAHGKASARASQGLWDQFNEMRYRLRGYATLVLHAPSDEIFAQLRTLADAECDRISPVRKRYTCSGFTPEPGGYVVRRRRK
jgi:hypothetical protein